MKNTERIKQALRQVQEEHRSANSSFNYAQKDIDRINNTKINIFYDDVHGRIHEAVKTALDACGRLHTKCQELVEQLDRQCRPLLEPDTPIELIQEIAREIEALNEDSHIENNYTGDLDGLSFGHVATVQYSPSSACRMIESFWFGLVNKHRQAEADTAYMAEHHITQAEISQHRQYHSLVLKMDKATTLEDWQKLRDSFISLKDCWDAASYLATCEKRVAEIKEAAAEAKRQAERERVEHAKRKLKAENAEDEHKEKVAAFGKVLHLEVKERLAAYKENLQQQIEAIRQEKAQQETALANLGFFAFGAKKEQKAQIEQLEQRLRALQSPQNVEGEKNRLESIANAAKERYQQRVMEHLYNRFPGLAPCEPKYVFPAGDEGVALRMLWLMENDKHYASTELMALLEPEIGEVSSSYMNTLLKTLKNHDDIIRIEAKGHAYFARVRSDQEIQNRLVLEDTESTKYLEVEEFADYPCPEPPSVEGVFD